MIKEAFSDKNLWDFGKVFEKKKEEEGIGVPLEHLT